MTSSRRNPLIALTAMALLLAGLMLSACGASNETEHVAEGEQVTLGNIEYNLVFSRYLNPNDNEDSAYLVGQPPVAPHGLYLGLFLQVKNKSSDETATLPLNFKVRDTFGAEFDAIPNDSLFSLPLAGRLEPEMGFPTQDSTAQTGPIEGSMLLFQIPQSVTENRPLELVIPGEEEDATIDIDL